MPWEFGFMECIIQKFWVQSHLEAETHLRLPHWTRKFANITTIYTQVKTQPLQKEKEGRHGMAEAGYWVSY